MSLPYSATASNVFGIYKSEHAKEEPFVTIKFVSSELTNQEEFGTHFTIQVLDGSVKPGDIVQIVLFRKWKGSHQPHSKHLNEVKYKWINCCQVIITEEMLNNDLYEKSGIIKVTNIDESETGCGIGSTGGIYGDTSYLHSKAIRIRRPVYKNGKEVDSIYSNYIPIKTCYIHGGEDSERTFIVDANN